MERQTKPIREALVTSLVVLAIAGQAARGQYAGGAGTADDPYLIETAEQMNSIGLYPEDWSRHFRLTANIDMNDLGGAKVNLIGTINTPFRGVFDGNDHTIANLAYLVTDEDSPPTSTLVVDIGLFRVIGGGEALVKNLGLIDPNLRTDPNCTRETMYTGALVGRLREGWVRNCYVEGGRVHGGTTVGGLVGGCSLDAAVSESWSATEVSGDDGVGGLVGSVGAASVWSCHAVARVSGGIDVGGLAGICSQEGAIEDCFTTGTITGRQAGGFVGTLLQGNGSQAGGLVGALQEGRVARCYSTVSLSGGAGSFSLGGLVGVNRGLIHTSWAGGEIAGGTQVGGLVGNNAVGDGVWVPYFDTKVTDSYATGAVRGDNLVGGLVGYNDGTLLRCYASGAVTTTGAVPTSKPQYSIGGLVATHKGSLELNIQGCFWDTTASGVSESDGGTGMTTAQMQDAAIYLAADWDFTGETDNGVEDTWTMSDDGPGYPKLAWEATPDPNATD